jgi:hypothetical protein
VRPRTTLAVALLATAALTACSSGGSGDATPPAAATSASASAPDPATSSPSAPSTSTAASALKPFTVLPDSELAVIPNFAYVAAAGQDEQVAGQGQKEAVNAAFSGAISRQMLYTGQEVGGVQLWRFRDKPSVSTQVQLLTFMVGGFGGAAPTTGTLNGVPVALVENARGSQITGVGFLTGQDLILVWSQGTEAAQRLAYSYMQAAGITTTVSPSPSASKS